MKVNQVTCNSVCDNFREKEVMEMWWWIATIIVWLFSAA